MNIGLLGFDDSISPLVVAARREGSRIAVAADLPTDVSRGMAIDATDAPREVSWEALLDLGTCDVIFVGADGWHEGRAEAVRKLVQAGRPLVLSQPLESSMLYAYELDMIRRDSAATLIPFLPDRLHPFIGRLRDWIGERLPNDGVESITFERRLADRSRDNVLRWFCRDADLIRLLAGAPGRLSTLGAADPSTAWSTLAVGLTTPGHPPARWQVVRGDTPGLSITAVAADARVTIEVPGVLSLEAGGRAPSHSPVAPLSWTWHGPDGTASVPFDRGAVILGVVRDALASGPTHTDPGPASWDDAARGVELAETVPRSLAKGRGIDLHQEEFTEIGTFKGTMASLGCGIVLLALAMVVVATVLGGIARQTGWEWGEHLAGIWPLIVLGAMGLFLLLQFLPLLIATHPSEAEPPVSPGKPGKP